jgi:hypothetical protein
MNLNYTYDEKTGLYENDLQTKPEEKPEDWREREKNAGDPFRNWRP